MSRPLPYFVKIDDTATNLPGYIHGFFGEHRFLSNFHIHQPLTYQYLPVFSTQYPFAGSDAWKELISDDCFSSSEGYYQFCKVLLVLQYNDGQFGPRLFDQGEWYDGERLDKEMKFYQTASPTDIKKRAATIKMTPEQIKHWDSIRVEVMFAALEAKFCDPVLRQKLLDTNNAHLEESLWWNDKFWGVQYENNKYGVAPESCYSLAQDGTAWWSQGGKNMLGKCLMNVRERIRMIDEGKNKDGVLS